MKKMKLFEAMRECGRHIWLCETNQISYNEIELQQLRIIEENILVYLAEGTVGLETVLQNKKRNYNSVDLYPRKKVLGKCPHFSFF